MGVVEFSFLDTVRFDGLLFESLSSLKKIIGYFEKLSCIAPLLDG